MTARQPAGPPRRRRARSFAGLAAVIVGGATIVALGASFADFLSRMDAGTAEAHRHAEGAVALTGGSDRITEAVELVARGDADRLLITGVNPTTSRADLARKIPQVKALYGCCIELGYEASNTVGNAEETGRWVRAHNIHSLIVVTSSYHMPRALAEIGSVLPDIALVPYPVVSDHDRERPWWCDGQRAKLVLTEYLKYQVAQVRLRLSPPRPDSPQTTAAD